MAEVVWSRLAEEQLRRAVRYIAIEQGTVYAEVVLAKILEAVDVVEVHPKAGQIELLLRHKKGEYRYVVAWSFKIVYRLSRKRVVISRVFHM
jgi:toxin ParE1/3/4